VRPGGEVAAGMARRSPVYPWTPAGCYLSRMTLLPPDDDLERVHTRHYETRVYRLSDQALLARGAISDLKPPNLYIEGDFEPLEMHRMVIELEVALPSLAITRAQVLFETHPHSSCPLVAPRYEQLVGLSIVRGFTHKVRELFGGPRGCTHTNALLQAMAPAVVQSIWSVSLKKGRVQGQPPAARRAEDRERAMATSLNTCHVWSEEGEHVAALRRGERSGFPPLPVRERLAALGRRPEDWE